VARTEVRGRDWVRAGARALSSATVIVAALTAAGGTAHAEKISNPVAEFTGLDKITGQIRTFDVLIDETVQFGALQLTPRVCYSRPPTEPPRTTTFVEVDEVTLDRKIQRIFTGWMFAGSPGLNAVDHPIYDVWLTNCKTSSDELGIGN
jgi:hypothetical protein